MKIWRREAPLFIYVNIIPTNVTLTEEQIKLIQRNINLAPQHRSNYLLDDESNLVLLISNLLTHLSLNQTIKSYDISIP